MIDFKIGDRYAYTDDHNSPFLLIGEIVTLSPTTIGVASLQGYYNKQGTPVTYCRKPSGELATFLKDTFMKYNPELMEAYVSPETVKEVLISTKKCWYQFWR
jgi:hypothetical protein